MICIFLEVSSKYFVFFIFRRNPVFGGWVGPVLKQLEGEYGNKTFSWNHLIVKHLNVVFIDFDVEIELPVKNPLFLDNFDFFFQINNYKWTFSVCFGWNWGGNFLFFHRLLRLFLEFDLFIMILWLDSSWGKNRFIELGSLILKSVGLFLFHLKSFWELFRKHLFEWLLVIVGPSLEYETGLSDWLHKLFIFIFDVNRKSAILFIIERGVHLVQLWSWRHGMSPTLLFNCDNILSGDELKAIRIFLFHLIWGYGNEK